MENFLATLGDDTKGRILKAAHETFGYYGFQKTSMDLVADKLEISRPAVYQYFKGKRDLFASLSDRLQGYAHGRMVEAVDGAKTFGEKMEVAFEERDFWLLDAGAGTLHGHEVVSGHMTHAAEITVKYREAFRDKLLEVVRAAQRKGEINLKPLGLRPTEWLDLLIFSVRGIETQLPDIASIRADFRKLMRVFLSGIKGL